MILRLRSEQITTSGLILQTSSACMNGLRDSAPRWGGSSARSATQRMAVAIFPSRTAVRFNRIIAMEMRQFMKVQQGNSDLNVFAVTIQRNHGMIYVN